MLVGRNNFIVLFRSEKIDDKKEKKKSDGKNKHCHDPGHLHRLYTSVNFNIITRNPDIV